MTPPPNVSHDRTSVDLRATLALGAGVAVGLGVLRGVAQVVSQKAYAHPLRMVAVMAATSAIWLVVPLIADRILHAPIGRVARWIVLGTFALLFSAVEPYWFFGALARVANWRGGPVYWVNSLLRLDTNLLIFGAIVGWLWLREFNRRRVLAAERAASLRVRASDAELDVLTMQLQPHFLFNTLNLVSQLAYENTTRARRAIANLRKLLTESVASAGSATVTLAEELRLLDAYLELQRDRFGDRLDARVVADVELLDARVPRMLLQPIVENAIRHGIAPRKSGGSVQVRIRRGFGSRVSIDVTDDGVGLQGDAPEGMGLANVRHRLEQLYPGEARVELSARDGVGAMTRLDFPFDKRESSHAVDSNVDVDSNDTRDGGVYNVGRRLRASAMILGWLLIAAVWSEMEAVVAIVSRKPVPWGDIIGRYALNAVIWIALTPLALWLADRIAKKSVTWRLLAHLSGAVLFSAVHLWLWGALMRMMMHSTGGTVASSRNNWAIWDILAYVALVAIGETAAARVRLREQQIEASRESGRLASARISMLRLHLQPSLLLSAVDAVDASIGDPVRCETTITHLGDVLRMLLATSSVERVALHHELALLESYAAVIDLPVSVNFTDAVDRNAPVPSMILCSLVASSVAHSLSVNVSRRGPRLVIELVANGDLALGDDALAMTEQRLATLYAANHAVRLVRRDDQSSIVLELPRRPGITDERQSPIFERRAIA
ncbi:MAG TPA: histidine kinase [Gemmatimonadaceae bacterium]